MSDNSLPDWSTVQGTSSEEWSAEKEDGSQTRWEKASERWQSPPDAETPWTGPLTIASSHDLPRGSAHHAQTPRYSVSPFALAETMASRSNNQFISSGLLKIYHDVLENNLTCWLTEATCPYKSIDEAKAGEITLVSKQEWGPEWSNRIYGRTIELDRVALANRMISVSHNEDQAASRAFNLAIMAFAAQWAQGSKRQRETYESHRDSSFDPTGTAEFDRKMQRQLWEEAKAALQEVSDVESFKVAAAEIIFALTQKPLTAEPEHTGLFSNIDGDDLKSRIMAKLAALISAEGPPVYMERAARKMHALKARFDSSCQKCGSTTHRSGKKSTCKGTLITSENRATIDLLYWLAVMFDTISSSMNDRPVVVSDEESRHAPYFGHLPKHEQQFETEPGAVPGRWSVELFIQDSVREPKRIPVWPCSYEEAADAVIKSAPIKVLLFRQISYLQGVIRKGLQGKLVEDQVTTAISVFHYWELTYGAFFRALVNNIASVPFRIQSWFATIAAHWHLAALMLGDLLDYIDDNELGTESWMQRRKDEGVAESIRNKTIKDLADIAKISTPRAEEPDKTTASHQERLHHAVNGCVILTEPWTVILIRAFSMASAILLGEAEKLIKASNGNLEAAGEDLVDKLSMTEECIKALWHLGKKSDLSRRSAEILSVALNKLHVCISTRGR